MERKWVKLKNQKSLLIILSFSVSFIIFVTSVFADISSKTEYEQLKYYIENTIKNMDSDMANYTITSEEVYEKDNKILFKNITRTKFDFKNSKYEEIKEENLDYINKINNYYDYYDLNMYIVSDDNKNYTIIDFQDENEFFNYRENPLENFFSEFILENDFNVLVLEKLLGSLKNEIILKEKEGKRVYSIDLKSEDISRVQEFILHTLNGSVILNEDNEYEGYSGTDFESFDVLDVNLNVVVNENNLTEKIFLEYTIKCEDLVGGEFKNIHIEKLIKLENVNNTKVEAVNLDDREVSYETISNESENLNIYKGRWMTNIVENGEKIGEINLNIKEYNDNEVVFNYSESYLNNKENIDIDKKIDLSSEYLYNFTVSYNDIELGKVNVNINLNSSSISIFKDYFGDSKQYEFRKVFED
jgi:hypothetical protein